MIQVLSLYNLISNKEKRFFESKLEFLDLQKGDFLLLDGEVQNKLYLVSSGLQMMYYDTDKKRHVIDFAYQNRFCVDISSFSNQTPSNYCIECMEVSRVEAISYANLMEAFDLCPNIERAYRNLMERVLASVIKRQLNLSLLSIQERFNQIVSTRPELFRLVPHKHIASYLNIDPTNFSKLFNRACKNRIEFY